MSLGRPSARTHLYMLMADWYHGEYMTIRDHAWSVYISCEESSTSLAISDNVFDVSEHQDGAIRILYQSHTGNNIMQGSGHILSNCKNVVEYTKGIAMTR